MHRKMLEIKALRLGELMKDAQQILEQLQMGIVYEAEIGNESGVNAICQQLADFSAEEPHLASEISGILDIVNAERGGRSAY